MANGFHPLRLIPPPLHRQLYRLVHRLRRRFFRWTGLTLRGSAILARDHEGRFLLVRHSYGPPVWTFPGGGLHRNEDPAQGMRREFREELGCGLTALQLVTVSDESYLGTTNIVHVFTGLVDGEPKVDRRELVEARFFARDEFPADASRAVKGRMRQFDAMASDPAVCLQPHGSQPKAM